MIHLKGSNDYLCSAKHEQLVALEVTDGVWLVLIMLLLFNMVIWQKQQ